MNNLDWLVIFLYCIGIIGFAVHYSRGQKNAHDYFLAGRRIKWWQSGASTMTTQLSAVTMKDIYQRYVKKQATERHYLISSKIITFIWGIFCIMFAILLSASGQATRQTTIVVLNAVGSMLYGPVLAAFIIGMFSRTVAPATVKTAVIAGLPANISLWQFTDISWMWWNASGFIVPVIAAIVGTLFVKIPVPQATSDSRIALQEQSGINWKKRYALIALYAVLI